MIIAVGAAIAAWLLALGISGRGSSERARRERLIARVRGDTEQLVIHEDGPKRKEARRGFGLRKRPRLALRSPQRGLAARIETKLRRAGSEMQPGEFMIFSLVIVFAVTLAGISIKGNVGGFAGLAIGLALPQLWLMRQASVRRKRINAQLNDLLQVIAGGLSAGQSFMQALAAATREVGPPLGVELQTLLNEVELGATLENSLNRLRERIGDDDLDLVIDAVLIQRRIGGNLSEVLNNISWTIRERIKMRGEVKALTGQARISGLFLSGLPILVGVGMYMMNPEYMMPLFTYQLGRIAIIGGLISVGIGMMLMRKIANVEV
ncbi:MAG: type II secretion system F family protein [Dehalococcoidia bacterium]